VRCRAVVVAVDGGLETLLPELAPRARSTRLQMLATAPVAPGTVACPVYDNWGHDYWQQLPDGRIALGGGRDRFRDAEWGRPAEPDAVVQAWLDRLLRERVGIDAPVTHRWAGVVAYTDDGLPVLEEVRPGVIASGGLCGHGNVLGSAAARAATAIALGEPVRRSRDTCGPRCGVRWFRPCGRATKAAMIRRWPAVRSRPRPTRRAGAAPTR
jgi:glycine/D-amino acid oxidase-like deaminating enzyme